MRVSFLSDKKIKEINLKNTSVDPVANVKMADIAIKKELINKFITLAKKPGNTGKKFEKAEDGKGFKKQKLTGEVDRAYVTYELTLYGDDKEPLTVSIEKYTAPGELGISTESNKDPDRLKINGTLIYQCSTHWIRKDLKRQNPNIDDAIMDGLYAHLKTFADNSEDPADNSEDPDVKRLFHIE